VNFGRVEVDAEHQEFARSVRELLDAVVTDEVVESERVSGSGLMESVHLALGERGWILPSWPVEAGGADLDPLARALLDAELALHRVPDLGTTMFALPAVQKYADPEVAAEVIPGIAKGTVRICLGYTEPDGGSDIAAAKVRAVRDGDEWIINGSKIFTTGAQWCQYCFLVTRTDPDRPKHKGLTMFLLPMDSAGVQVQAVRTYGGERTNVVYFGDVRISDRYRLGEVNDGWTVLHGPLDAEHSLGEGADELPIGGGYLPHVDDSLSASVNWATRTQRSDGTRVIDDPTVLMRLGQVALDLEETLSTAAPMARVRRGDAAVADSALLVDLVGPQALLSHGTDGAVDDGAVEYAHRWAQGVPIYGGTNEVFKNIIAQHVLGLPRAQLPGSKAFISNGRRSNLDPPSRAS
jgi:alkylation response protein AidB-like acyl-CoA dehydrogenase